VEGEGVVRDRLDTVVQLVFARENGKHAGNGERGRLVDRPMRACACGERTMYAYA
jgi:hypothetical protein